MHLPANFNLAFQFVLISEGGLVKDPIDLGGETKYGITEKSYPNLDIPNITLQQATEIYYNDYWLKQHCDKFDLPLATIIFDSSVNCGRSRAGKWMQQVINKRTSVLKEDGIIGPSTVHGSKSKPELHTVLGIAGLRAKHYAQLIQKHPEQMRFIAGWNNRLGNLLLYII